MLKLEIEAWVDQKKRDFLQEENRVLRLNLLEWLGKYVYSYIHEIFFVDFPTILNEWLVRLTFKKRCFQGGDPRFWTLEVLSILLLFSRLIKIGL